MVLHHREVDHDQRFRIGGNLEGNADSVWNDRISDRHEFEKIYSQTSIKPNMMTLIYLLKKEFRQIFRNKAVLPMILVMPLIQLIILPLAADFEVKNINISIIDRDHSSL